jgi:hypothetical protein
MRSDERITMRLKVHKVMMDEMVKAGISLEVASARAYRDVLALSDVLLSRRYEKIVFAEQVADHLRLVTSIRDDV